MDSEARLESGHRYDTFNFWEKQEKDFQALLRQKSLEFLERQHQHCQELADQHDRRIHASYTEWNRRFQDLRQDLLEKLEKLKEHNATLQKINDWHLKRMTDLDLLDFYAEFIQPVSEEYTTHLLAK